MHMNKLLTIFILLSTVLGLQAQELSSPDKNLKFKFRLQDNRVPTYEPSYKTNP